MTCSAIILSLLTAPSSLLLAAHPIVHVNAALNATATVLLFSGWLLIRQGRVNAHKWAMLAAFVTSTAFLVCYAAYHARVGHVEFTTTGWPRTVYLAVLLTHIPLAFCVPFLAIWQIYLGYRATGCCAPENSEVASAARAAVYRGRHRGWARWTLPIWLYVSITGVLVYVMLYHIWPSGQ